MGDEIHWKFLADGTITLFSNDLIKVQIPNAYPFLSDDVLMVKEFKRKRTVGREKKGK